MMYGVVHYALVCLLCFNFLFEIADLYTCIKVYPEGDVSAIIGDDIQLSCKLNTSDPSCNNFIVDNITIVKGIGHLQTDILEYNNYEEAVSMVIHNATLEDAGLYMCVYGSEKTHAITNVAFGEPPIVEQLRCISRNFDEFECSFQHNQHDMFNWSMEFNENDQIWMKFPKSRCNQSIILYSCSLSRSDESNELAYYPSSSYQVRATVRNRFGKTSRSITIENTSKIVKPTPVEDLTHQLDSGTVRIHWRCPKSLRFFSLTLLRLDYRIWIKSAWNNYAILIQNSTEVEQSELLDSLVPFTKYSVSVQAKSSSASSEIYWSYQKAIAFTTLSAVSPYTVLMTPGSYITWQCGNREICLAIYWKNPEERYWYGSLTGYNLSLVIDDNYNQQHVNPAARNEQECKHSQTSEISEEINGVIEFWVLDARLLTHLNYRVQIRLKNVVGESDSYEEIAIPNWQTAQSLRPSWVVVEVSENSVDISWSPMTWHCSLITMVTFYWCVEDLNGTSTSNGLVSCSVNNTGFDWVKQNVTDGCGPQAGYSIRTISNRYEIKYGVSLETSKFSGGLKWENFRFTKDRALEEPVYSVNTDGTTMVIHVHYKHYHHSNGGRPQNYTVLYYKYDDNNEDDSTNHVNISFSANFLDDIYTIDHLHADSQYSVQVASVNDFGRTKYGDQVIVTTVPDANAQTTMIVSLTLVGAILCGVVLCCCCCVVRRRYKMIRYKTTIIIPEQCELAAMLETAHDKDRTDTPTNLSGGSGPSTGTESSASLGESRQSYIRLGDGNTSNSFRSSQSYTASTDSSRSTVTSGINSNSIPNMIHFPTCFEVSTLSRDRVHDNGQINGIRDITLSTLDDSDMQNIAEYHSTGGSRCGTETSDYHVADGTAGMPRLDERFLGQQSESGRSNEFFTNRIDHAATAFESNELTGDYVKAL